jgi:hypothetical protein
MSDFFWLTEAQIDRLKGTPVPHAMGTDKALLSNRKAPQVPGVRQAHSWRAYVKRRQRHTGGRP